MMKKETKRKVYQKYLANIISILFENHFWVSILLRAFGGNIHTSDTFHVCSV